MQRRGRINWFAILVGYGAAYSVTLIAQLIALIMNPDILRETYIASVGGIIIGLFVIVATVFGGWIAGRISREERFLHGFLVGGISIVSLLIISFFRELPPVDRVVVQIIATVLAGIAGYVSDRVPTQQRGKE